MSTMMEKDEHLGYSKFERSDSENARNGVQKPKVSIAAMGVFGLVSLRMYAKGMTGGGRNLTYQFDKSIVV